MISDTKRLIAALPTILSELELTEVLGRNEESFAELKRILKQRIHDLEECAAIPISDATTAKAASESD